MEVKQDYKKCEICKLEATCLCHKCMSYFCDSCFKFVHSKDANKNHIKENIDYYVPIDLKCPEHSLYVMGLFCVDEKELCCPLCHYYNVHDGHKVLSIEDEEALKKENISIEYSSKEYDTKVEKLNNLKNLIEKEMIEIDNTYDKVDKEVTESYKIKRDKINKEEENLKEKLKTEVTKIKEKFEISISEINTL